MEFGNQRSSEIEDGSSGGSETNKNQDYVGLVVNYVGQKANRFGFLHDRK